ncbi:MAG: Flp pilus assembly protein CpaB [Anaerolinea sp.]|nr:Flp pilus assembly protein CpaB [Anaerolinea sp.]
MLAAVFGILSALLMFAFLSSKGGGSEKESVLGGGPAESVVVATRDVSAGEKITSDMLEPRSFPASTLLAGAILSKDSESLIGKVATSPIFQGEQVITPKVTTYEGQNSISWKVPDGMRALSLQVPHEAWIAAGLPQPGDRVDILAITTLTRTDPLTGQERPDVVAGYMAEDVEVLAVSQTLVKKVVNVDAKAKADGTGAAPPAAVSVSSDDKGATYEKAISITVALPPDLAAKVALVDAMDDGDGQYRILPRQKGDAKPLSGSITWSYDDIFPAKKK